MPAALRLADAGSTVDNEYLVHATNDQLNGFNVAAGKQRSW